MTLRLRLTLLYGGCFIIAGAALLAITYGLVAGDPFLQRDRAYILRGAKLSISVPAIAAEGQIADPGTSITAGPGVFLRSNSGATTSSGQSKQTAGGKRRPPASLLAAVKRVKTLSQRQLDQLASRARNALAQQQAQSLQSLLTRSGIALAIMALASIGLGWWMAGRALRPLRTINDRARAITAESLHERLGLERRDELGQLAATVDGLLGRLERAFASQRRFVANASHELRTPVTLERAVLEVALADPEATPESLRRACERVLASNAHQERIIDGLLTLARGQAGAGSRERVDLGALATELSTLREHENPFIRWETNCAPALVHGDPVLIERLIANLADNAVAYNDPDEGWIAISTGTDGAHATLRVANAGAIVPEDRMAGLFEPFRRLDGERLADGHGVGLGLSIVAAIAEASGATVDAHARPAGGLDVSVAFPAVAAISAAGRSPDRTTAAPLRPPAAPV